MNDQTNNDPIVIGIEQVQGALTSLGITDLGTVQEVRIKPIALEVVRKVLDEGGRPVIEAEDIVTVTSTVPLIWDEDTEAALSRPTAEETR